MEARVLTEAVICELLCQAVSYRHPRDPFLTLHGLKKQPKE